MSEDHDHPTPGEAPATLKIGSLLGRYCVLDRIGRGGMGEVFLAHDERLDRDVVLKVLRPTAMQQLQWRQRFQREALALSRLNHPSIATIFDFDHDDEIDFLVMEYVEGETLTAHIKRGPMSEKEVLRVASQVCVALAEAHAHGILHRDLSPGNVMITNRGVVKVLDFGLAKMIGEEPSASAATETLWATKQVAGTVPYIAPERLRGQAADERSDIYALGALLYEMATRQRVFEGDTPAELIAATLDREPLPPQQIDSEINLELARCILKALDKEPERRYQSAREMAVDVDRARSPFIEFGAARHIPRRLMGYAIVLLALLSVYFYWEGNRASFPEAVEMTALVTGPDWESSCHISPDGKWLSYQTSVDGVSEISQRALNGADTRRITTVPGVIADHDWSPDGERIAFVRQTPAGQLLQIIPAFGGPVRESIPIPPRLQSIASISWTRTGVYLDGSRDGLWRVDLDTGETHQIMEGNSEEGRRLGFEVCKGGDRVVYTVRERSRFAIWTTDLDDGKARRLTRHDRSDLRPRWLGPHSNFVVHTSNRTGQSDLWMTDLKGRSTRLTFGGGIEHATSGSRDGSLLSYLQETHRSDLFLLDPAATLKQPVRLTGDTLEDLWPSASNIGNRIAFHRRARAIDEFDPAYQSQILCGRLGSEGLEDLRTVAPRGGMATLSPDGKWLAYALPDRRRQLALEIVHLESGHSETVDHGLPTPLFGVTPFRPLWSDLHWSALTGSLFYVTRDSRRQMIRNISPHLDVGPVDIVAEEEGWLRQPLTSLDGASLAYVLEVEDHNETSTATFRLRTQLHLWSFAETQNRVLYEEVGDEFSMLLLVGQRPDGHWLLLRRTTAATLETPPALVQIDSSGVSETLMEFPGGVGPCVLDSARDTLYLAWNTPGSGVQNLYSVNLVARTRTQLTANENRNQLLSHPELLADGRVLYTQHEGSSDIWLIRFEP
jgi:serine/threonine protein kinase